MPRMVIGDDWSLVKIRPLHSGTFKWVWFKRRALANNSHLLVLRAIKAQALSRQKLLPPKAKCASHSLSSLFLPAFSSCPLMLLSSDKKESPRLVAIRALPPTHAQAQCLGLWSLRRPAAAGRPLLRPAVTFVVHVSFWSTWTER
jgi:hypothetical protein